MDVLKINDDDDDVESYSFRRVVLFAPKSFILGSGEPHGTLLMSTKQTIDCMNPPLNWPKCQNCCLLLIRGSSTSGRKNHVMISQ